MINNKQNRKNIPNPRVIFWNPNTSQYFLTHQILRQKTTYIECEIAARHDYLQKFHGCKLLREDLGNITWLINAFWLLTK